MFTEEGKSFFDWFYAMYECEFEELEKVSTVDSDFNLFDVRLNNALSASVEMKSGFRHLQDEKHRTAYAMMLKLCDVWFCYEALLIAFNSEGLIENPRSKVNALSEDTLDIIESEHNIFEVLLDFWGMNGGIVHKGDHRSDMQKYIDYLSSKATSREQKTYLPQVYNLFTNNDQFSTPQILSFAYAVRNQYVHAGESPQTGVDQIETKIAALSFSHDFLVLFCLRAGEYLLKYKRNKAV
ncbi:hypothetical protein C4G67_RS23120 [Vibrio parahaemolyticus]|nr:hypothetical protein [Vibrio parahaemolyticus]